MGNKTQYKAIVWQHEIIKHLTDIKLHNNYRKLNNDNICSNILKVENPIKTRFKEFAVVTYITV